MKAEKDKHKALGDKFINFIMGSSTHCKDAIDWPVMNQYYNINK